MSKGENMNNKDDNNMSAEQMLEIFLKIRPHLFDHIYKECNLIHNQESLEKDSETYLYFNNEDLNIAKAIIYDYGNDRANKMGHILIAATEDRRINK
jgi:hypothetical protein